MKADQLIDCAQVARDLLAQPEFWEHYRDDLPGPSCTRPSLALARYTGARSDDEQLNLRVGAMRLLGMSDRAIERECGIDRRTIPYRLAWCEKAARIPATKDRLLMIAANVAEVSGMVLTGLLDRAASGETSVDLAAMIRAAAGAHLGAVEKTQLLTGGPTEILQVQVGAGRDQVEAWLRANSIPIDAVPSLDDSHSTDTATKQAQSAQIAGARGPDVAQVLPSEAADHAPVATGDDIGGGVAVSPGPPDERSV